MFLALFGGGRLIDSDLDNSGVSAVSNRHLSTNSIPVVYYMAMCLISISLLMALLRWLETI